MATVSLELTREQLVSILGQMPPQELLALMEEIEDRFLAERIMETEGEELMDRETTWATYQRMSFEKQLQLLRGQVELLERALKLEREREKTGARHRLTREEYHEHLEATRGKALDDIEPTELIRRMRIKE